MKFKSIISLLAILVISQCKSTVIKPQDISKFELFESLNEAVTHRPLVLEDVEDDKEEPEHDINTLRNALNFDDELEDQSTTESGEDVDEATESPNVLRPDIISKDFNDLIDENKLNPSVILVDNENQPTTTVTHHPLPLPLPFATPSVAPVGAGNDTSSEVTSVDNESESQLPVTSVEDKTTTTPSIVLVDDADDTEMLSNVTSDDKSEPTLPVTSVDNKSTTPSIAPAVLVADDTETSPKVTPIDNESTPIPSTTSIDDRNKSEPPVLPKNNVSESESSMIPKNDDVTTQSTIDVEKHRSHRIAELTKEEEAKFINSLSGKFDTSADAAEPGFTKPTINDENKPKPRRIEPKPPVLSGDNSDNNPDSVIPPYAKYNVDLLNHNQAPVQSIPPVVRLFPPFPPISSRIPAIPQFPHSLIPEIPSIRIPTPPAFQIPQFPTRFPYFKNFPVPNDRTGYFYQHPFHHYPTQQVPNFYNHPYHNYQNRGIKYSNNHPYHHYPTKNTRNFYSKPSNNYLNNIMRSSNNYLNRYQSQY